MVRKVVYLLLTAFFILLAFYLVDFKEVGMAIVGVKWHFAVLAVVLSLLSSLPAALRLKILFSRVSVLPIKFIWAVGYVASLTSLIIPFYVGGFGAAYLLAKKAKVSYRKSFAILFTDFLFGIVVTLILGALGIFYFYQKGLIDLRLGNLEIPLISLSALIVLTALFLILKSKNKVIRSFFFRIKNFSAIFNIKILFLTTLLTFLVFVLGIASSYIYFLAFGLSPKVVDFILATSLFSLLGLIPGAPGKIGQYETFGVITLPFLLELDKNRVFATLFVNHTISIAATIALGIVSLYLLNIKFSKIGQLFDLRR